MIERLRLVRWNRSAAAVCLLVTLGFAEPTAADPNIVGDASLLETVKEALERNQEALSQGECDIRMEYGQTADPLASGYSCSTTADVHLLWSGDQSYSSYTFVEDTIGDEWPARNAFGAQIIKGETRTVYVPEGFLCETHPFRPSGFPSFRDVLPADICFHMLHYRDKPWTTFLGEATLVEESQWVDEIDLAQEGDVIRIKLFGARDAYTGFEFFVPHGCNLTSWESVGEAGEKIMWGSHEWAEVDGVWYPTLSTHEWRHESTDGSLVLKFRMEISDFIPNPVIESDAFTIEALELPNGTELIQKDAIGRQIGESRYYSPP